MELRSGDSEDPLLEISSYLAVVSQWPLHATQWRNIDSRVDR